MLDLVALSLPSSKISFNTFDGTMLSNLGANCPKSNFLSSSSFWSLLLMAIYFYAYFSPHFKALSLSLSGKALMWTSFEVEGLTLSKIFWYSSLIYLRISFSYCSYLSLTMCFWFSNFFKVSFNPSSSSAVFLWRASAFPIDPGYLFSMSAFTLSTIFLASFSSSSISASFFCLSVLMWSLVFL